MDNLLTLSKFGFLTVTGKDSLKFLQGYTTCDLENLGAQQVRPGAICNIQGRMVANFYLVAIDSGFLLRMTRDLVPVTIDFLQKYIVFSKAETHDMSDSIQCYGLMEARADFPPLKGTFSVTDDDRIVCLDPDEPRYEIWTKTLRTASTDISQWITADIASGQAWVDNVSTGKFIPQMLNLQQAEGISFDKGCYLGQEIIARMQYRGKLKKRLHRGRAEQASSIEVGNSLFNSAQKSVGTIVTHQGHDFLAVIQTKDGDGPQYFLSNKTAVAVTDLE